MEFAGDPSNFEDWSLWRNFHEAGCLITTHFHVFLPTFVTLLFPGSLIQVVYVYFLTETFSLGASFPGLVVIAVPPNLVYHAFPKILHEMKTTVYALDSVRYPEGALSGRDCYAGRSAPAVAVEIVCFLVYVFSVVPVHAFKFAGVAVGMPKWTAVLFTPLLAVGMSLLNLYLVLLLNLVVKLWSCEA